MKKKKIIFLMNSLEHGGTERVVTTLADSIKSKYEVKIYTLFDKKVIDTKIEHHSLLKNKNPYMFFFLLPVYVAKLKKMLKHEKPDLVISFLEFSNILNIITRKKEKTIISVRAHISEVYKKRKSRFLFIPIIKSLYKKSDHVIVNSENAKIDLIKEFDVKKERIKVIYNPVDINKIRELSEDKIEAEYKDVFNKNKLVLVNLGRLTYQKAQVNLIKIIKNLETTEDVKLVIIGTGELKAYLSNLVKKWNLEKKVLLLGDKKNPFKYLKRADIFVFTSFYEGLPNAMLEAMACGLPVMSADCRTGPREILAPDTNPEANAKSEEKSKYGILCPSFDQKINPLEKEELSYEEKIFKKTLENLIKDKRLMTEYSKMSKKRIKDFDKKLITAKFVKFIEEQT